MAKSVKQADKNQQPKKLVTKTTQVHFHYENSGWSGLLNIFPRHSLMEDMAASKIELIFAKYGAWNNSPGWRALAICSKIGIWNFLSDLLLLSPVQRFGVKSQNSDGPTEKRHRVRLSSECLHAVTTIVMFGERRSVWAGTPCRGALKEQLDVAPVLPRCSRYNNAE